jgi:hypothetical protein
MRGEEELAHLHAAMLRLGVTVPEAYGERKGLFKIQDQLRSSPDGNVLSKC